MTVSLKCLPKEDLPRERLTRLGAEALSNEELLSIIFRTGAKGEPVYNLSKAVLSEFDDIAELKDVSINKLKKIKGLGDVKIITLLASLELGKRVFDTNRVKDKIKVLNSVDAYRFFAKYIVDLKQENLLAIYLDTRKQYISHKIIFKGTINQSVISAREIFIEALFVNAASIIIMHNHPSGNVSPSRYDDEATKVVIDAGNTIGIPVLDHLIVARGNYYSYDEEGRIKYE